MYLDNSSSIFNTLYGNPLSSKSFPSIKNNPKIFGSGHSGDFGFNQIEYSDSTFSKFKVLPFNSGKGGGGNLHGGTPITSKENGSSSTNAGLRQRVVASPNTAEQFSSNDTNTHSSNGFGESKKADSTKISLVEEVLLLGLKDVEGYFSFWNDNLSYVLRGCILIELALRKRIKVLKDQSTVITDTMDRPLEVISTVPTGEMLLDETLRVLKNTDKNRSTASWMDLLSGETWNISKAGYQLKQVRERLAKGLVDKGVLRTEKKNFMFFDKATHPIQDHRAKDEIVLRLFDTLNLPRSAVLLGRPTASNMALAASSGYFSPPINQNSVTSKVRFTLLDAPKYYKNEDKLSYALLRRVCLVCCALSANVLENPLSHLDIETRDYAFLRAEEILNVYGNWPFLRDQKLFADVSEPDPSSSQTEEVVAAVLSVLRRMDRVI
ncbi:hypothetical protein BB560_004199 [Smittium megazygosporum]|uniref:Uncharacterized protein n=1 Tax=Smittium megazygosporum TaxID=133381 RepID=A0A2T9Z9V1_9FUNG|nr:hypothetical protein BB560_004199 [Smittium megazygosporum]